MIPVGILGPAMPKQSTVKFVIQQNSFGSLPHHDKALVEFDICLVFKHGIGVIQTVSNVFRQLVPAKYLKHVGMLHVLNAQRKVGTIKCVMYALH